ncbi:MAG: NB-ARC domain-containing protein, partial [Limisphaerales bacterium]
MHIEINKLPTHMAQVGRRLNIVSPDDVAATFLEASYLAEVAIKTITLVFLSGVRDRIPDHAYRFSHGLVRADGLGTWEATIRELVSHPLAGFLPPEFQQMLAWAIKRRTKPEDAWFQDARTATANVLRELGSDAEETARGLTVKELITAFVQIRNKTKAHGAVGADFYSAANVHYIAAVRALITNCPAFQWQWMHLMIRDNASIRGVLLQGDNARHMTAAELAAFTPPFPGVYFVPERPTQTVHVPRIVGCFELLKTTRECTSFLLPNGGFTSNGEAEFIDYATGKTSKENVSVFLSPPVPLPASETEGAPTLDVQSNAFGNLPILPNGYVERKLLQDELTRRLLDKNHPTITLHGMGGVGKTSLALFTAHHLASAATPHFDFIVWFSARDVDLRPSGPSSVRPSVVDVNAVSKAFGSLFGVDPTIESFAKVLQSPKQHTDKGILFIFDNFETMADVTGIHKFLDEHTHLPNKVLITSRERAFVADFPIEVRSMEYDEASQMLYAVARELSIESLVTEEVVRGIYQHTGGHAYVMRVVLGEMAKEGRYTPPKQLIPRRMDIVDAVFERSFNKLSDPGRNVFLTVANWKSEVAELALIVVLGQRGLDVEAGIDECKRLSLILPHEMVDQQPCYSAPQLARV